MKIINDILQHIAYSIANGEYVWTDQEKVAIKDNSHVAGEWSDLFISVNAFLNTGGGHIIIGIKDDEENNKYVFNGFDPRNEAKLKLIVAEFTDINGVAKDISEYIRYEMLPFLNGDVVAIHIDALPESEKHVFYKGAAYERLVTGDHRITGLKTNVTDEVIVSPVYDLTEVPVEPAEEPIVAAVAETPIPVTEPEEEIKEQAPAFQQLYSGELITIFGSDYISLEPDLKQMLAFIYERNNSADNKYPSAEEVSKKLWEIKGGGNALEEDLHKKKIKKVLFLFEKNDMLIRIKAQYRLNTSYEVVKNLFN